MFAGGHLADLCSVDNGSSRLGVLIERHQCLVLVRPRIYRDRFGKRLQSDVEPKCKQDSQRANPKLHNGDVQSRILVSDVGEAWMSYCSS